MIKELQDFAIRLAVVLCISPVAGFFILKFAEEFEVAWRTNIRRKKWFVCCGVFLILAGVGGWLQA